MSRVLKRMLGAVVRERGARAELRAVAAEQAAVRRVAALVAGGAEPGAVFAAVAAEAGNVLPGADWTVVGRYDGRAGEVAGGWSRAGHGPAAGRRLEPGGQDVSTLVFRTGRPARVDGLALGAAAAGAAEAGMASAAGAPVSAGGRLWGVVIAASARRDG